MQYSLFLVISCCLCWCPPPGQTQKQSEIAKPTKKFTKLQQKLNNDQNDLMDFGLHTTSVGEASLMVSTSSTSPSTLDFLQESFDFNPNDFEDLHENFKKGNLSYDEDENDSDEETKSIPKLTDAGTQHILKIAAKPSPKSWQMVKSMNDDHDDEHDYSKAAMKIYTATNEDHRVVVDQFELLKKLFDHNLWDVDTIWHNQNISLHCRRNMKVYLNELHSYKQWALKVSDTSGHYTGQITFGNEYWLGSQHYCVELNEEEIYRPFELHFSVIRMDTKFHKFVKEGKSLTIGQCLPKECCINDIRAILQLDKSYQYLSRNFDNTTLSGRRHSRANDENHIKVKIQGVRKVPGDFNVFSEKKFYVLSAIVILLIIIMGSATYYENKLNKDTRNAPLKFSTKKFDGGKHGVCIIGIELNKMSNNNNSSTCDNHNGAAVENRTTKPKPHNEDRDGDEATNNRIHRIMLKILLCFSVDSNAKRILSVDPLPQDSLTCVHGIRTLSLLWTIMVHTYLQLYLIAENKFNRKLAERTFGYQMIGNASYSVDTFFFLSGLLVTLLFLRKLKSDTNPEKAIGNVRYVMRVMNKVAVFVAYRFIRLTPVYLFIIFLTNVSLKNTFNNSVFPPGVADHVTCEKYWWRNILYINNWYPFKDFCMIWSWYLANDMQFYLLATTLLLFSVKYFKSIVSAVIAILVSSWFVTAFMSFKHSYTHKVGDPFESFDFLYDKPWQRVGPYIMGMITGYIYFNYKRPKISLQTNLALWGASLSILFAIVFGVYKGELSIVMTAFYVSLGHTAWGLALIWITLSCCWGFAHRVNLILSYPLFYPLSRLTYCTYLIHPVIQILTSHFMTGSLHLEHSLVLTMFMGNAVISFLIAFVLSLALEAPFVQMLKLIVNK